jgi:hypothetical protein
MAVLLKTLVPEHQQFIFVDRLIPHDGSLLDRGIHKCLFVLTGGRKPLHLLRSSTCSSTQQHSSQLEVLPAAIRIRYSSSRIADLETGPRLLARLPEDLSR